MIQDKLIRLCPLFSNVAIECVSDMFSKSCEIKMPWKVVEHLQGQFDRILTIGSSSNKFKAVTIAGIQHDSLKAFIGQENISTAYASDVLGEFVNTFIDKLTNHEEFQIKFGTFTQSVPVIYTKGHSYLSFNWGIEGYIYIGIHWVYIGYSITEKMLG